jgi:YVTN family beta-propeller protein
MQIETDTQRLNARGSERPRALFMALFSVFLATSATAQIGGPGRTAATGGAPASSAPAVITHRHEKEGLLVDFTLAAAPGENQNRGLESGAAAVATFSITDKRTGQPVAGLHPNAWISGRKSGRREIGEAECKDTIRGFMGGLLSTRAEIDLNSYLLLTLNHDHTITFINPQVSFNITKMESIVQLPGRGADWALSKNREFLYVTMPEQAAIAVVNTLTRKLIDTIPTIAGAKPRRLTLSADGRRLWVGLDETPRVAVIDTGSNKLHSIVEVGGGGLHSIALTPDGRYAFVTNSDGDRVAALDAQALRLLGQIKVGRTPGPVAYGAASGNVYVAAINGAQVSVIDPAARRVVATIPARPGIVALRFEPQGRYAFAVNQVDSAVSVIDTATNKIVGAAGVVKSPDQVVFSDGYAYVRGIGSEKFSLIGLKDVAAGKIAPVDIQAGRRPPGDSPEDIGVADMIAATPEGASAMIANAPDQMIYYYAEGMMAPMGTLTNYKRRPLALLILDRSLAEVKPGAYSTPLKLASAGRFAVSFLLDQPRVVNCFEFEVAQSPDGEKLLAGPPLVITPEFRDARYVPGKALPLRFSIKETTDGSPVEGLTDVQVLVFEPPGIWQQRQWAREVGKGVYEVTQTFPRTGLYKVMFQVSSRGAKHRDLISVDVSVVKEASKDASVKNER